MYIIKFLAVKTAGLPSSTAVLSSATVVCGWPHGEVWSLQPSGEGRQQLLQ